MKLDNAYMKKSVEKDLVTLREGKAELSRSLQKLANQITQDVTAMCVQNGPDRSRKDSRDGYQIEELQRRIQDLERKMRDNARDKDSSSNMALAQETYAVQRLEALESCFETRMNKLDENMRISIESACKLKDSYEDLAKKFIDQQNEIERLQKVKKEGILAMIETQVEAVSLSHLESVIKNNATALSSVLRPLLMSSMLEQATGVLKESVITSSEFISTVQDMLPKDLVNQQLMKEFVQSTAHEIRSDLLKSMDGLFSAVDGVATKLSTLQDDSAKQRDEVAFCKAIVVDAEKFNSSMTYLTQIRKELSAISDAHFPNNHEAETNSTHLTIILNKLNAELNLLSSKVQENSRQIANNDAHLNRMKEKETLPLAQVPPTLPFNSLGNNTNPSALERGLSLPEWQTSMETKMAAQNGNMQTLWSINRNHDVRLADLYQRIAILNTQPVVDQMIQRMREIYPILDMQTVHNWCLQVDSKMERAQVTAEKAMMGQELLQNFAILLMQWIGKIRPMIEQAGDIAHPGLERVVFWFKRVEQEMQKAMMGSKSDEPERNRSS
jgi:hypothetical protein